MHAVDLMRPGVAPKLEGDLGGSMQARRLEDVPASQGPAGDVHRKTAARIVGAPRGVPAGLSAFRQAERLEVLKLLVREAIVNLGQADLRGGPTDLRQPIRHLSRELGVDRPDPVPRLEARGIGRPSDAADPDGIRMEPLRGRLRGEDEHDAAVRRVRDVEGAQRGEPFLRLEDLIHVHAGPVGGERVAQPILPVLRDDLGERFAGGFRAAEERVRLQARHDEGVGSERLVPDRVEGVFYDAVQRGDVRGFAMRLDDGDIDESGLNLHEGVREPLEPVAGDRAHPPQDGPELVRDEFVENPEALVVVLGARDEGIDVRSRVQPRVRVRAGGRLEHQLLPAVLRGRRTKSRHSHPDDPDPHLLPSVDVSRAREARDRTKDCRTHPGRKDLRPARR